MESPLPCDDQDDESKSQFKQLLNAIFSINSNSSEEDVSVLNERIQREVTAKPILARIVQHECSLLSVTCAMPNELFHPAIKCLIGANSSALLWQSRLGERVIHDIAAHRSHCVLMPWIATNYQWVLNHEICLEDPPACAFLYQYADRREEEETGCTAAIIRQFFEAYPQGLTQVNESEGTPLHIILMGTVECEADLFKWMAEQCPSNMLKTGRVEENPLHRACDSLTDHMGVESSEICKYLVSKCPESVQMLDVDEWLPIHCLLDHCQHQVIKEVVVLLLREYPESYDIATCRIIIASPSSIPFIQRIKPLLDEERELKANVAYLQDVAGVFRDAVNGTQTPSSLASSTCDAFVNWATLTSVQRLEAKMEHISMQLQQECNIDEEEEEDSHAD